MVLTYLFVSEDETAKDLKLEQIKHALFSPRPKLESFNFEILHAEDLDANTLKEKLLQLPVVSPQRLVVIKNIPRLKTDARKYLLSYLAKPFAHLTLILEARRLDLRNPFFKHIVKFTKPIIFRQSIELNAFTLAREVIHRRIKPALKIQRRLLLEGERPERILGALRFLVNRERMDERQRLKKLALMLSCDVDIKSGRLRPEYALERLLVRLCCF